MMEKDNQQRIWAMEYLGFILGIAGAPIGIVRWGRKRRLAQENVEMFLNNERRNPRLQGYSDSELIRNTTILYYISVFVFVLLWIFLGLSLIVF